jgi:hypothetical protein
MHSWETASAPGDVEDNVENNGEGEGWWGKFETVKGSAAFDVSAMFWEPDCDGADGGRKMIVFSHISRNNLPFRIQLFIMWIKERFALLLLGDYIHG